MTDVLLVVLGGVLGIGLSALARRRRTGGRPRPPAVPAPQPLSTALLESVTAFGEEVQALPFEPRAGEPVLTEYREVLDCYDRAACATDPADALASLRDGRAAMIRLAARRAGRAVPISALPPLPPHLPAPAAPTGERFTTQGRGAAEVLIDRPEPGRHCLIEVSGTGKGSLTLDALLRTEVEATVLESVLRAARTFRSRRLLRPESTHLRIRTSSDLYAWTVRILPLSGVAPLGPETRGRGDDVFHHVGGPALLTLQTRGAGAHASFDCACLSVVSCRCAGTRWARDAPGRDRDISVSVDDPHRTLRLPGAGYVTVSSGYEWYLTLRPATPRRSFRRAPGPN